MDILFTMCKGKYIKMKAIYVYQLMLIYQIDSRK